MANVPRTTSLNGMGTDRTCDKPQRSNHIPSTSNESVFADLIFYLHIVHNCLRYCAFIYEKSTLYL